MPQTDYSVYAEGGIAGQLATHYPNGIVSRFNAANSAIPFGYGVIHTSSGDFDDVALPTNSTAVSFAGVAVRTLMYEGNSIPDNRQFDVLKKGQICVPTEEPIVKNDPIFLRCKPTATTNAWAVPGVYRKSEDGAASAATCVPVTGRFVAKISNTLAIAEFDII